MKLFFLPVVFLLVLFVLPGTGLAQNIRISAGDIYTISSKTGKKLLDVSNASMEDGAPVDCWTNTGSDAERWVVTDAGDDAYTLTNVGSGKLLHIASGPAGPPGVDQHSGAGVKEIKWMIKKAGRGYYRVTPFADRDLSLSLREGDTADGARVGLSLSSGNDGQQWSFQRVARQDAAPTAAIAGRAFDAWYTRYHVDTSMGFWDKAEMMETLLDAYEVTGDTGYVTRFRIMYHNFIRNNGADWMYNKYNDDITWAVLFCVRGYLLTGNKAYLKQGKDQFDKMYARARTNTYGGGLLWYQTKTSKNACINGPAMVACCYLAEATGDSTYYDRAIALYTWSKLYLFDTATGKINDNVNLSRSGNIRISRWSSTYNQGTYLGAAVMLYRHTGKSAYLSDAGKIARYARDSMYRAKVIDNEDGGNDLPGFKGIFVRYARKYTIECHQTDLVPWLRLNARVAYNNRNSNGLIRTKWGTRTGEKDPRSAFGSSTAVSLFFNTFFLQPRK